MDAGTIDFIMSAIFAQILRGMALIPLRVANGTARRGIVFFHTVAALKPIIASMGDPYRCQVYLIYPHDTFQIDFLHSDRLLYLKCYILC